MTAPGASSQGSLTPNHLLAQDLPAQVLPTQDLLASSRPGETCSVPAPAPIMDAFGNPLELPAHISPHRVFALLDQALPFEVCLYHRVIPLALEEDQLRLGMVDIHDAQALDYVSRIAGYSDRTLIPIPLAGHLHQVLLSAYLHHSSQLAESANAAEVVTAVAPSAAIPSEACAAIAPPMNAAALTASDTDATQVLTDATMPDGPSASSAQRPSAAIPQPQTLEEWELETLFPTQTLVQGQSLRDLGIPDSSIETSTLEVEQPGHLETRPMSEAKAESIAQRQQEPSPAISQRMTLILDETEIMAQVAQAAQTAQHAQNSPNGMGGGEPPTLIEGLEQGKGHRQAEAARLGQYRDIVEEIPSLTDNPALPANLDRFTRGELNQRNWRAIAHLPPNLILQAMLGRMLQGNITRLRMERCCRPQSHGDLAQLFWNPAGVLQPTWKEFSLGSFGALAKALRELAQLPLGPILKPIQRGVMRRYHGQPILLLMQFLPGAQVAAIELRLLQGKALQEFQQSQGKDLGREALLTAQTLQHQVQQLLDHHQRYPESSEIPKQLLTVIGQLEKALAGQTAKQPLAEKTGLIRQ